MINWAHVYWSLSCKLTMLNYSNNNHTDSIDFFPLKPKQIKNELYAYFWHDRWLLVFGNYIAKPCHTGSGEWVEHFCHVLQFLLTSNWFDCVVWVFGCNISWIYIWCICIFDSMLNVAASAAVDNKLHYRCFIVIWRVMKRLKSDFIIIISYN